MCFTLNLVLNYFFLICRINTFLIKTFFSFKKLLKEIDIDEIAKPEIINFLACFLISSDILSN